MFVDLSKTFDYGNHILLLDTLSEDGLGCSLPFSLYRWTQVKILKGVPLFSLLGLDLFSTFINNTEMNMLKAELHLVVDDTIIYSVGSPLSGAVEELQTAFYLNANKTKFILFSRNNFKIRWTL